MNLLYNGSFDSGFGGWQNLIGDGASGYFGLSSSTPSGKGACLYVQINKLGTKPWSVQSIGPSWSAVKGAQYVMKYMAKSSVDGIKLTALQQNTTVIAQSSYLTTEWKEYVWNFTVGETQPRVKFHFPQLGRVFIDDVSILYVLPPPPPPLPPPPPEIPNIPGSKLPGEQAIKDINYADELTNTTNTNGRVLWVSADNGSDGNNGLSEDFPFQTLNKCISVAMPGDLCILRGTFRENARLVRSGTIDKPITFRAHPNYGACISSYDRITNLTPSGDGKTLTAEVPPISTTDLREWSPYHILCDGISTTCTFPEMPQPIENKNKLQSTNGSGRISENRGTTLEGGFLNYSSPSGIPLENLMPPTLDKYANTRTFLSIGSMWGVSQALVSSIEGDKMSYKGGNHNLSYCFPQKGSFFYLSGRKEFVKYPGAAHLERTSSSKYTLSIYPQTPDYKTVEYKRRTTCLDFNKQSYINFQGVTIRGNIAGITGETSNIKMSGMSFEYINQPISLDTKGSETLHSFELNGTQHTIENSFFVGCRYAAVRVVGTKCRIVNNVICNSDLCLDGRNFWEVQTNPGGSDSNVIVHNTMFNTIYVVAHMSTGLNYYNNDFFNANLQCTDSGLLSIVKTDCKGVEIAYNYLHDNWGLLDYPKTWYGGHGLYQDIGVSNTLLHHNVCWGTNGDNFDILAVGSDSTQDPNGKYSYNNTCVGNASIGTSIPAESTNCFKNNLCSNLKLPTVVPIQASNNVTGVTLADFVDPANFDFRLADTSKAKNAGTVLSNFPSAGTLLTKDAGAFQPGFDFIAGALITEKIAATCFWQNVSTLSKTCFRLRIPSPGRKAPLHLNVSVNGLDSGLLINPVVKNFPKYSYDISGKRTDNIFIGDFEVSGTIPNGISISPKIAIKIGNGKLVLLSTSEVVLV